MARRSLSRSQSLQAVPLFSACSKRELSQISKLLTEIELAPGDKLVRKGSSAREMFVISSGKALVTRNGRKLAELGPGEVVGELSLLDPGPRTATVEALTPMKVYLLDPRDFTSLLNTAPSVSVKIARALAARLRALEDNTLD